MCNSPIVSDPPLDVVNADLAAESALCGPVELSGLKIIPVEAEVLDGLVQALEATLIVLETRSWARRPTRWPEGLGNSNADLCDFIGKKLDAAKAVR